MKTTTQLREENEKGDRETISRMQLETALKVFLSISFVNYN